ncbi:MAG TPA: hypothetical protein VMR62_18870 [Bryobacteraceae bacterium]|nr:hypothetical protein [Bryobacteraceae bacterium]
MKRFSKVFLAEDGGQDLVEYTLLVAFVALASAGLFLGSGANVSQVWSSANNVLSAAGGSPATDTGGHDHGGNGGGH